MRVMNGTFSARNDLHPLHIPILGDLWIDAFFGERIWTVRRNREALVRARRDHHRATGGDAAARGGAGEDVVRVVVEGDKIAGRIPGVFGCGNFELRRTLPLIG